MSLNAKNLSYESNEPAFIRRLRGEHGDRDSSRHERPLARPRKQVQQGEEDDQPTYVAEDSQDILSKAEYEALVAADNVDKEDEDNSPLPAKASLGPKETESREDEVTRKTAIAKQQVAGIGGSSKRRLAKVIGDGEEEGPGQVDSGKDSKKSRFIKNGKKMKLSFDEEGTEP